VLSLLPVGWLGHFVYCRCQENGLCVVKILIKEVVCYLFVFLLHTLFGSKAGLQWAKAALGFSADRKIFVGKNVPAVTKNALNTCMYAPKQLLLPAGKTK